MTAEQKGTVQLRLSILKEAMKREGLIFGIAVDKKGGVFYDTRYMRFLR